MLKQGTRPFYVIYSANQYDGLSHYVHFITHDKKEAMKRFKWLYEQWVIRDYRNEEGDEFYNGRDFYMNEDKKDPTKVSGNFWYDDDDGGYCIWDLKTIHTNAFMNWNYMFNEGMTREYEEWAKTNRL